MESGHCRHCGRPFSAGEVTGLGILRPRLETKGGPLVEFTCPECRTVQLLVPHGNGRYSSPGEPPPPEPPESERQVPWRKASSGEKLSVNGEAKKPSPPPCRDPFPPPPPPLPPNKTRTSPAQVAVTEALELLGLTLGADAKSIERAYRERALLCHPDKVAHLDPEFLELAKRKFLRLQAARDLLLHGTPAP